MRMSHRRGWILAGLRLTELELALGVVVGRVCGVEQEVRLRTELRLTGRAVVVGMHSKGGEEVYFFFHSIFIFIFLKQQRPATYPTVTKTTHKIRYSLDTFNLGKCGEREGVFF